MNKLGPGGAYFNPITTSLPEVEQVLDILLSKEKVSLCNDIAPALKGIFWNRPLDGVTLDTMSHTVAEAVVRASYENVRFVCYPKFSHAGTDVSIVDTIYQRL